MITFKEVTSQQKPKIYVKDLKDRAFFYFKNGTAIRRDGKLNIYQKIDRITIPGGDKPYKGYYNIEQARIVCESDVTSWYHGEPVQEVSVNFEYSDI